MIPLSDKILAVYQAKYKFQFVKDKNDQDKQIQIFAFLDSGHKEILLRNEGKSEDKMAYKNVDILKEFTDFFRRRKVFTRSVLFKAVEDIEQAKKKDPKKKARESFLQNMAEYFFENLWQDDRKQFT